MSLKRNAAILLVTAISLSLIRALPPRVFASTLSLQITLQTDKLLYIPDELVTISGNITNSLGSAVSDVSVALEVRDPYSNIVFLDITISYNNGSYYDPFRLELTTPPGLYTVYAVASKTGYDSASNQTTFMVGNAHDIAITHVSISKTVISQGYTSQLNITVRNNGFATENTNVTAYANSTIIATILNITLASQDSTNVILTWNTTGFDKGNYTISAYAWPVLGETYIIDNTLGNGIVYVGIVGDINGDGKVDVKDVYAVGLGYGTSREGPNPPGRTYNPNCDINGDYKIDVKDYYIVCKHYGETDP